MNSQVRTGSKLGALLPRFSFGDTMCPSHSADVRLWLLIGDRAIKLSHTAGDFVVIAAGEPVEPCEPRRGVVVMFIDGTPFPRVVDLPDGIQGETVRVEPRK